MTDKIEGGIMDNLMGGVIVPHDEELPEQTDYLETQESIPTSLSSAHENLSPEDQKKFNYYLDNLKSQASEYRQLNGDVNVKMACINELASIAKAFITDFKDVSSEDILQYSASFVSGIQKNEFLELFIKGWLQLYIDAESERKDKEKPVEETRSGVIDGISKVLAQGLRGPRSFIKGNS